MGQLLLLAAKTIAIARGPIVVDGVLDDPVWQNAQWITDFEQQLPRFGAPPSHPIRVAVATDGEYLYVGARMTGKPVDDALTQRDDTAQAERFIISLDPSHTRRLAYSFAVTARGVRADWIHTDDSEGKRDTSWNPVWVAKTTIDADGWTAEMAIPLSQLRLPREPATSWGINFDWYIPYRQEDVFWRAVPPDRTAWSSYFGDLTELPPIEPGLGLEVMPYASTRLEASESGHHYLAGFEAGVDAKLHPTPSLTIAATVNPDFGQVEQDPAFVNLTAYEVYLAEKRPFFIENNSLFADAPDTYFYSRRIDHILGAVAAGGYIAPRTQIAVLGAVTDSPLSAWGAGRIEQQINTSVLGATATVVERSGGNAAFSSEVDSRLRTCDQTWELLTYAGVSAIYGTPAAITALEEDSTHYFQRPDQPHVHVDTDAHHLAGWEAGAAGSKRAGMWQGDAVIGLQSPGFDLNDVGATQSADDIDTGADIKRIVTTPGERLFSWDLAAGVGTGWNFGGVHKPSNVYAGADATTAGFYSGSLYAHWYVPGDSDDLTRGGPRMHVGSEEAFTASASTPYGRAQQLSGSVEVDVSPTFQQGVVASATLASRVVPALRLDVTPSLVLVETHRQYVATFESRYLFGHLERREAALQLRATWSLSPDLVFTLYAQPFYSHGTYDAIGELVAPGSGDVRWYGSAVHAGAKRSIFDDVTGEGFYINEPDYRVLSLRSTAVMRWEFRPGSILYVVWQQSRDQTTALHTLALKLSYWFG